jgi:hypothetical protein
MVNIVGNYSSLFLSGLEVGNVRKLGSHLEVLAAGQFLTSHQRYLSSEGSAPKAGRSGFTTDWSYSKPPPNSLFVACALPPIRILKGNQNYYVSTVHFLVFFNR